MPEEATLPPSMVLTHCQRSALVVGRRILCLYAGERLWHERLLLLAVDAPKAIWTIVTPDGDVYVEEYEHADVEAIRVVPLAGGKPAGLTGPIYPFRSPPTAVDKARWN